ncbi:Piso0_000900 [Millerozyma farinosa CBS 7064]|uniref:Piso0_000900 protein n=1 Tax=Pichia sorbitophila (strain ATCC MYA-4447 / BCRC 22081 / CBS 7064 / NBRC 10061 / NRRL Y-12695) TaxID=559304 RepID=G8YQD1_PICSO|nr:Piso0_000900 [Millerozyma farinosa CBS 7064]
MEEPNYRRMQVKVSYSFNNNPTVFLSRSKAQYSVKVAQIPLGEMSEEGEEATLTLGAFELSQCIQQILKCSPENFKLQTEDYVVYYKDVTEQPDEPFVSNGVLSSLMSDSKSVLVPGRVCQNVSASYLFGDKNNSPSLTLDIRLKLHIIERAEAHELSHKAAQPESQTSNKRSADAFVNPLKKSKIKPLSASSSSSNAAIKATRTKSLPIFYYPHNQQIFNIMNADKANVPSRYDSKSVQERFKSAPFLQAKVIDNPSQKKQMKRFAKTTKDLAEPQRAMRTRSMMTRRPATLPESSPIQEEPENDGSDDSDYNENADTVENENNGVSSDEMTPYSPQQAEYSAANSSNSSSHQFQALPDMEDLDSKKIHTIPHNKLPSNHDLTCINSNCATTSSISWRYFETSFHPNYLALHRATEFDKSNYEGMFGPLCNACYLFLRNKGFMRPEGVVKKYLQQQKYKKDSRQKDEHGSNPEHQLQYKSTTPHANSYRQNNVDRNVGNRNSDHSENFSSSPVSSHGRFLTPAHTPALINQAIQNSSGGHNRLNKERYEDANSLHYNELNEFMNQLNSFGGPLTDIDPLPQEQNTGLTPPMMATKSNTRVINLYDDGEDKENCPPVAKTVQDVNTQPSNKAALTDIEKMMAKTFHEYPDNSGTMQQGDIWLNDFFGEPTPRDTPSDLKQNMKGSNQLQSGNVVKYSEDTESEKEEAKSPHLPCLRTFTHNKSDSPNMTKDIVSNMPSSPFLSHGDNQDQNKTLSYNNNNRYISGGHVSSDQVSTSGDHQDRVNVSSPSKASRYDTTFSWNMNSNVDDMKQNTPNSELYSNDDHKVVSQVRSDQPAKNVSSS